MVLGSTEVSFLWIVISAVIVQFVGMLWYGPMFGKAWMKLSGMTVKQLADAKKKSMAKPILISFIASIVMIYVLAWIVGLVGASGFGAGAFVGFWIWLGFYATSMVNIVLWENKSVNLYWLNVLYHLVVLGIVGGILGAWA